MATHYAMPISSMGGGANLNVIYSASQPTNPKENTIWVKPSEIGAIDYYNMRLNTSTGDFFSSSTSGSSCRTAFFKCTPNQKYHFILDDAKTVLIASYTSISHALGYPNDGTGTILYGNGNTTNLPILNYTITAPSNAVGIAIWYYDSTVNTSIPNLSITEYTEPTKPLWGVGSENPFITKTVVNHLEGLTLTSGLFNTSGAVTAANTTNKEVYTADYIPVTNKEYRFLYTASASEKKALWLSICEYTGSEGSYTFSTRLNPITGGINTNRQQYFYTPSSDSVTAIRVTYRTYGIASLIMEEVIHNTSSIVQNGTTWIKTGTISNVSFNALSKNGLMTYFNGVYQWDGESWSGRKSSIYINGEWKDYMYYIFDAPNNINLLPPYSSERVIANGVTTVSFSGTSKTYCPKGSIDVTEWNYIDFVYNKYSSDKGQSDGAEWRFVGLANSAISGLVTSGYNTQLAAYERPLPIYENEVTFTVDISSVTGLKYIFEQYHSYGTFTAELKYIRFRK